MPGLFSKKDAPEPAPEPAAEAPAINPAPPAPPQPPPPHPNPAPWANPACVACEGSGISSKLDPCRTCVSTCADIDLAPQNQGFRVENGVAVWGLSEAPQGALTPPPPASESAAEPLPPKRRRGRPKGSKNKPKAPPTPPASEPEVEGAYPGKEPPAVQEATPPPAPSPPPQTRVVEGLILCVGCTPIGLPSRPLESFLDDARTKMAQELGHPSYWAFPAFERRELMAQIAQTLCEKMGTGYITCHSHDPDTEAFLAVLRGLVDGVIQA